MSTSKVLEEANSIAEKIAIFNQEDENPYHQIKQKISEKNIKHIVTVARGTSDCAALYASYLFAKTLGLTTYSLPPSIITLENSHFDFSNTKITKKNGKALINFDVLAGSVINMHDTFKNLVKINFSL